VTLFAPARRNAREGDEAMFWLKAGDRVRFIRVKTLS
jgi:hypothetical protein